MLGDFTKQLAAQATKDVLDALRPADLTKISESVKTPKPPGGDNAAATVLGQIQAMQKALKEDDELVVLWQAGAETVRVLEVFVPSPNVLVLSGIDTARNVTRVITHIEALQLVAKVMKAQPPAKPIRVGLVVAKTAG